MSVQCPVCDGRRAGECGARNGYELIRCRACAHLYVTRWPDADELREFYRRYSYDAHGLDDTPPFVFQRLREMFQPFERFRVSGRLLDVGFGAGCTLRVGEELGWQAYGIETSELAVELARRNGFSHVSHGSLLDAPYPDGWFDVITMYELVEHLPDPRAFVAHAFRLLRPGGLLQLSTPNGHGLSARILGARWTVVNPPEHINLFSPRSIRELLGAVGFVRVQVSAEGLNPSELVQAARERLRRSAAAPAPASDGDGDGAAPSPPPATAQPMSSYELNRRLLASRSGRWLKATANAMLAASRLGDGLKISAVRA